MLEKIPSAVGRAARGLRSDPDRLLFHRPELARVPQLIRLSSPAFGNDTLLPARFTADGPGTSPPLQWQDAPEATAELVLVIEDPDAPAREPLVHLIAWGFRGQAGALAEGALNASARHADAPIGRNSYLSRAYLPPDPPSGHGAHRYAFEIFALGAPLHFDAVPGRSALLGKLADHAIGRGLLTGIYGRP